MSEGQSVVSTSSRGFYELLGVSKDATDEEIKRGWKIKSLSAHPDKGGSSEAFVQLKYAYDVLRDPGKRRVYDHCGEAGVKALEGNASFETFMAMVHNVGWKERCILVMILASCAGYLLLFPILLCVRWDNPHSMTFAQVFIPVWVTLAVVMLCFCVLRPPSHDPDLDSPELHAKQDEEILQTRRLKLVGLSLVTLLLLLLIFLVLRLDGNTHWSYWMVLWPWLLLEFLACGCKLWVAEIVFVHMGHDPAVASHGKWLTKEWNVFMMAYMRGHVFRIAFICLVALKMDGMNLSWWAVFLPLWIDWALTLIATLMQCGSVKPDEVLEAMPEEARFAEPTHGKIAFECVCHLLALGCVVLVCAKLAHPDAFPAFIVFLPLFVTVGCLCCVLSCAVCCMDGYPMEQQRKEESQYGSTSGNSQAIFSQA